jgi:3-hydroxy-3-methylglutaryl CoA synthase
MGATSDFGITGFGAYAPRLRIERAAIADAHRWMNPSLRSGAKGTRAFCSWDEDVITMGVEAARDCLAGRSRDDIRSLQLASTTFPYADLSNGVIVGAALGLGRDLRVVNSAGSQRAATTALIEALSAGEDATLVIASEKLTPTPAGAAEMQTGAGAGALLVGSQGLIARLLAVTSRAVHFADHFRAAGSASDYVWEERWVRDEGYAKLVPEAITATLDKAGLKPADIRHLVLPAPIRGVAGSLAKQIGITGRIAGDFESEIGYCGVAHGFLGLAEVLSEAAAGERILLVGFGQGVDVLLFEATGLKKSGGRGLAGAIADKLVTTDYMRMLSFYDQIALNWGMRGEKSGKAALTEHYRASDQLDSFCGGRCVSCGTLQFPVLAYCVNPACCAPSKTFAPESLADKSASLLTVTSDWLSYHPAPPLAVGFVQFDAGARLLMEIVDARPDQITEGTPLRMVYRIKERDRMRGFNRYFWKATPLAA